MLFLWNQMPQSIHRTEADHQEVRVTCPSSIQENEVLCGSGLLVSELQHDVNSQTVHVSFHAVGLCPCQNKVHLENV